MSKYECGYFEIMCSAISWKTISNQINQPANQPDVQPKPTLQTYELTEKTSIENFELQTKVE